MISVNGTFKNGFVKLDKNYTSKNPVKVIITFLEKIETTEEVYLSISDFSFSKSQKNLQNFKGSLSDELISERRSKI
jgi:hypothetical protein